MSFDIVVAFVHQWKTMEIFAFLFGDALATVFQICAMTSKAKPPTLLTIGFALGGCLVPTGVIAWAETGGGGGKK